MTRIWPNPGHKVRANRMKWELWSILLPLFLVNVVANTEVEPFKVPPSFNYRQCSFIETPYSMSLKDKNYAKQTFEIPLHQSRLEKRPKGCWTQIFIDDTCNEDSYLVKISWSALYPVSIEFNPGQVITDDFSKYLTNKASDSGTNYACYRNYIELAVTNNSYPVMDPSIKVPINVVVVNTKFGIPVDLFGTLIYIGIILIIIVILDRKFNLYRLLID